MSLVDLTAMATYLKAQSEKKASTPWLATDIPQAQVEAMMKTGAQVYKDHCEACHQPKGEGIARILSAAGRNNESITMRNSVNAIRIVLNGGFPPSTEGNPRPYGMPPFYQDLSNEQGRGRGHLHPPVVGQQRAAHVALRSAALARRADGLTGRVCAAAPRRLLGLFTAPEPSSAALWSRPRLVLPTSTRGGFCQPPPAAQWD